jgi:tetraacyldisaccharide 4'-kinase
MSGAGGGRLPGPAFLRGGGGVLGPAVRAGLVPLSLLYAAAVRARNLSFDRRWRRQDRLPVPTLSVGNLTTGGTGKTPFTCWLVEKAREAGARIGIVTRGYRGEEGFNDEVEMVRARYPDLAVGVGKDRGAAARRLLIERPEIDAIVLDDGFQHRQVLRNRDLLLVDATDPFGGGACLPRGLLREPVSEVRRADLVVLTRADQAEPEEVDRLWRGLHDLGYLGARIEAIHRPDRLDPIGSDRPPLPLEALRGKRVRLISAIASPRSFETTISSLGAQVIEHRVFPDHHRYRPADLPDLRDSDALWCMTEKDAPKIKGLGAFDGWVLRIDLALRMGESDLTSMLDALWGRHDR